MEKQFGTFLRRQREAKRITLRQFALSISMDASNYARIERGEVAPPSEKVLMKIAEGLEISVGSDAWYSLVFSAKVSRAEVPDEIMEREEIARLLPAFFAKLRGHEGASLESMFELWLKEAAGTAGRPDN